MGLILSLYGCAGAAFVVPEHLPAVPLEVEGAEAAVSLGTQDPESSAPVSRRLPVLEVSKWEGDTESKWKKLGLSDTFHDLNVESIPLNEFVQVALGDVLGLSFIVDPAVQNRQEPVTLRVSKPMASIKFLDTIEQVLSAYDVGLSLDSGTLQALPSNKLTSLAPTFVDQSARLAMRQGKILTIIPLRYSSPDEALRFARHFVQIGSAATVDTMRRLNALMVVGDAAKIDKFKAVVEMVDRPSMAGRKFQLIKVTYWTAGEMVSLLQDALRAQGVEVAEAPEAAGVYIAEIKQLNTIMLAAPDRSIIDWANDWVRSLDTPEMAGDSSRSFVYYVKHSTASDLGGVVAQVLTRAGQSSDDSSSGDSGSMQAGAVKEVAGNNSGLHLVVDDQHNALVFVGSAQAYKTAHQLLQQLDVPVKQVLLEVTVADVNLDVTNQLGVEWRYASSSTGGLSNDVFTTFGGGLTYSVFDSSNNLRARLSALETEGKANILSSPKLLALDNEEARIQVGTQIAVTSQEVDSNQTSTSGLLRSFTYIDTGVILSFQPTVMAEGVVRLSINQEVSTPGASNNNTPPINTRNVQTTLVAQSGSTVMIGGLITNNNTLSDTKIPFLGDIPLLGSLFRSRQATESSTEMIVLITPHVVETPVQIETLTEAFRSELGW